MPGTQPELAEQALGEAVDGEDLGPVEVGEGFLEAGCGDGAGVAGSRLRRWVDVFVMLRMPSPASLRSPPLPKGEQRTMRACVQRFDNSFADSGAEFGGCGVGEGDDEDLVQRHALFGDEAGDQGGDGEGLAGAGAGFDDGAAVAEWLVRVEVAEAVIASSPATAG